MPVKRVLVVEDDPVVRELMKRILQGMGAEPVLVEVGASADEILAAAGVVDLVIMDMILPGVTGWEMISRIRGQEGENSGAPVVVLTGTALSAEERQRLLTKVQAVQDKQTFTVPSFRALLGRWLSSGERV